MDRQAEQLRALAEARGLYCATEPQLPLQKRAQDQVLLCGVRKLCAGRGAPRAGRGRAHSPPDWLPIQARTASNAA